MNSPTAPAAEPHETTSSLSGEAATTETDAQYPADEDALREVLQQVVAQADPSPLRHLVIAHNRTVRHTGIGCHV